MIRNLFIYSVMKKRRKGSDSEVWNKGKDREQLLYLVRKERLCGSAESEFTTFVKITLLAKDDKNLAKLSIGLIVESALMSAPK